MFPISFRGYLALLIWLLILAGLSLYLFRRRQVPQLRRPPYIALLGVLGLLALVAGFPSSIPLFPLVIGEPWVWFPLMFTVALLALYILGLPEGFGFTLVLTLVAAWWYEQRVTLVLEYLSLVLVWALSAYMIRRYLPRLRYPFLGASLVTAASAGLLFILADLVWTLDFALNWSWVLEVGRTFLYPRLPWRVSEILLGGLVLEVAHRFWQRRLGEDFDRPLWRPLLWDPSLHHLYLTVALPLSVIIWSFLSLMGLNMAEQQVQLQLQDQLRRIAQNVDHQVSFFMESGQLAITDLARQLVGTDQPEELRGIMNLLLDNSRFFHQLLLVDTQGQVLTQVRRPGMPEYPLSPEERRAIRLMARTPELHYLEVVETPSLETTYVAFLARLPARPTWILLGRAWLTDHPQFEPVLWNLEYIANELQGRGFLLDANNRPLILVPGDYAFVDVVQYEVLPLLEEPQGQRPVPDLQWIRLSNGRWFVGFQYPISGYAWTLIVLFPLQYLHQFTAQFGSSLLLWSTAGWLALLGAGWWTLRKVTASLKRLAQAAQELAQGNLDRPLPQGGVAEVRQLQESFEYMRQNLKRRLDELQQLLEVGKRLVTTLDWDLVVEPVLEGALYLPEATDTRVALVDDFYPPDLRPEAPRFFGRGPHHQLLGHLDGWLLQRLTQEDYREAPLARLWEQLPTAPPLPQALQQAWVLLLPLWHRGQPMGVFYVLFRERPRHQDSLLRYYRALSEQLRLALSNARLFAQAATERRRLEAILWATPDAIFMTDNRLQVVLANRSARRLLGWPDDDNAYPREFEAPFAQDVLLNMLLATPEAPQSHEIRAPDGRVFFVTVAPVKVQQRQVGMVGILRDITHLKQAEVSRVEFVMGISHDLRSPLAQIQGYATLLERVGQLNEKQRLYIQKIRDAVKQIHTMVDNLLELGRLDMGIQPQWELVPLAETVMSVVRSFEFRAQQKQLRLECIVDPEAPPFIEADPDLLQRALRNLVDNAIKFTPEGGRVTVKVLPKGRDRVLLVVEDTGIGIEPADRERLFERFFQAENARRIHAGGKGLGLAIVKSVVELHHGRIWVESQVGKGTRFFIELPLHPARVAREKAARATAPPASS